MKTPLLKLRPVESISNLRDRVDRLFRESHRGANSSTQLQLDVSSAAAYEFGIASPRKTIADFLNFISDAMPGGGIYIFGGVLRDLALLGRRGFNSDIDLVVEGNWAHFVSYLGSMNARKNKFGGYRLVVDGWPIDIWNAEETWAIKEGLVPYKGIASLTETTVLNWDAILMNWRTRAFIYRQKYFEEIRLRVLDIVLEANPNPLGMAVRVFRHLCSKDARKITPSAARYLAKCTREYSFEDLQRAEIKSYGNSVIDRPVYSFFEQIDTTEIQNIRHQFSIAGDLVARELGLE